MKTPQWAQDLIIDAALHLESLGYTRDLPDIRWRRPMSRYCDRWGNVIGKKRRDCSSGVCYQTHITICGGTDRTGAKIVLLHELAHWFRPWGEHHSSAFWDLAWILFRWARLPVRVTLARERSYRKGAAAAYRRSR